MKCCLGKLPLTATALTININISPDPGDYSCQLHAMKTDGAVGNGRDVQYINLLRGRKDLSWTEYSSIMVGQRVHLDGHLELMEWNCRMGYWNG